MLPPRRTRCQLRVRAQPSLQFRKSIAFYSRRHPAATNYPLLCIWRGAVNSTARARAPMRRPGCNRINRRRGATFSRQSRLLTRRLPSAHARARAASPRREGPGAIAFAAAVGARPWQDRNDSRFHGGRVHRRASIIILRCRSASPWCSVRGASANVLPWRARPCHTLAHSAMLRVIPSALVEINSPS